MHQVANITQARSSFRKCAVMAKRDINAEVTYSMSEGLRAGGQKTKTKWI